MEKLYLFKSKGYLTTFAVRPDYFDRAIKNNLFGPDSGRDIHHQLLFKEYKKINCYPPFVHFPVAYRHIDGNRLRDMIDMRFDGECILISNKLKTILYENALTGWETFPVIVYGKKGNEINGYNGFTVTGKGGERVVLPHPEEDLFYYGKPEYNQWDIREWDGTDFFQIKPGYVGVTQKVKYLFSANKIESPEFTPIEERFSIIGLK